MKIKYLFVAAIVALLTAATFSTNDTAEDPKAQATVKKYRQMYIFMDSKPVLEYKLLGTVKILPSYVSYKIIRDQHISKAKARFPNANAIVIHPDNVTIADAIRILNVQPTEEAETDQEDQD